MNAPKRVLFIRFSAIGDVLLTTPLIRLFHDAFPNAEIDYLLKEPFAPLVEHHPLLHRVISLPYSPSLGALRETVRDLRRRHYDAIFDLQGHWQSNFIGRLTKPGRIYRYKKYVLRRFLLVYFKLNYYRGIPATIPERYFSALKALGIPWQPLPMEIHFPESVSRKVNQEWPFTEGEKVIALAPGAGRNTKRWPVDYFKEYLRLFEGASGIAFLLIGGQADQPICAELEEATKGKLVNWCGKTSLLETAAALRKCELLVTNDTGVMHMAAALRRKVVALFGPTVREFGFFPYGTESRVLEVADLSCRPCSFHGSAKCPRSHFRCMLEITPEQVYRATQELAGPELGKLNGS